MENVYSISKTLKLCVLTLLQLSMLPQPTARPAGSVMRALSEVSESENNARTAMPPPSSTGSSLKRQGSNCGLRSISLQLFGLRMPVPEPAQKRKTLVERAGEPLRPTTTAPSTTSRPSSAAGQNAPSTTSLYRSASTSSSISRASSVSSRHTSTSSYTGSLSSGIRPPSVTSGTNTVRPKSSYGEKRGFRADSRPNTTLANLQASHEAHTNKSKNPSLPNMRGSNSMDTPSRKSMPPPAKQHSMSNLRRSGPPPTSSPVVWMRNRNRNLSLTTQLQNLHIRDTHSDGLAPPRTPMKHSSPSRIPKSTPPVPLATPTPTKTPQLRHRSSMKPRKYLTSDTHLESFDPDETYQNFKRMFEDSMNKIENANKENNVYRETVTKLEQERSSQTESIILIKAENQTLQYQLESAERSAQELKRDLEQRIEDIKQTHRTDLDSLRQTQRDETERIRRDHKEELQDLRQKHEEILDRERTQRVEALSQVSTATVLEKQRHQVELDQKDQIIAGLKVEADRITSDLERERQLGDGLRETLRTAGENASSMEITRQGLQAKIAYLESDSKSQSESYAAMEKRMNEAIAKSETIEEKLRKEEAHRRRLHNQIQELKGNIRVFCRVRPHLTDEDESTKMKFPNPEESTDIEVRGQEEKNSLGKEITKTHPFSFDRVFDPNKTNDDVFGEISQLIQSALDGFNVCIFAYGQTGSGKTFTMSSEDGMIPRALRQIYNTSKDLEDRGWKYKMEGSFVEVYNEEIRDLLGEDDKGQKKHEVHHDLLNGETTITNATILNLDNKEQVESILSQAMTRRSVAATKANEHSSRSHSVFILKLVGQNSVTGEVSKGTLNLVDLAGSERIKNAETSGQRLKETQSINKSLSCLGDVIGALGQGQPGGSDIRLSSTRDSTGMISTAHIPYRNSKLTYLLQLSLGGNCKTLMFVMVAPEKKCLGETITSLKFAEKVSRTRVGIAKKVK